MPLYSFVIQTEVDLYVTGEAATGYSLVCCTGCCLWGSREVWKFQPAVAGWSPNTALHKHWWKNTCVTVHTPIELAGMFRCSVSQLPSPLYVKPTLYASNIGLPLPTGLVGHPICPTSTCMTIHHSKHPS
jgi:hypothetical protein